MPVKVYCRNCGYLLAEYKDFIRDFAWSDKLKELLIRTYENPEPKCPQCGRQLPTFEQARQTMEVTVKENKK